MYELLYGEGPFLATCPKEYLRIAQSREFDWDLDKEENQIPFKIIKLIENCLKYHPSDRLDIA